MYTTALRKVGGSTMLAIPSAFLDQLDLKAGSSVGMEIDHGRLVIEPKQRKRYTLDELLAQCDPLAPMSADDAEWLNSPPSGDELI